MFKELLETGEQFADKFKEGDFGGVYICENEKAKYFQWLSKIGMYAECKLKDMCPEITKQILSFISNKTQDKDEYNMIIGYLKTAIELGK
ncbi:hypothetical protein FDB39_05685 [Clostridium botulinum]|nr:hypothetical protein [Clostridium botulinum]